MIVGATLTVRLSVTVNGSRRCVFAAMTDPEQVAEWWDPQGFTYPEVNLDVRVGGVYGIAMRPLWVSCSTWSVPTSKSFRRQRERSGTPSTALSANKNTTSSADPGADQPRPTQDLTRPTAS